MFDWPNSYLNDPTGDIAIQFGRKDALVPKWAGPLTFSSTPNLVKKKFGEEAKGFKATVELNEQIKSLRASVSIRQI